MKRKDLVLLTLLLTQTAPACATHGLDDEKTTIPVHQQKGSPAKVADQEEEPQIDLDELRASIEKAKKDTKERMARYDNIPCKENKVLVVGFSANGKTTLIEGLAGNLFPKDKGGEIKLRSRNPLPDFKIGKGDGNAGTKLPGGWYDEEKSHDMVFWDCPGFGDPGNKGEDIINEAARRVLITPHTQARVLLVMDQNVVFEAQPRAIQDLLNEVAKVFPNTTELKKRLSVVITKKTSDKNPQSRLKFLSDKKSLHQLTEPARDLFKFIVENMDTRLAYLPVATEGETYEFDKEKIFKVIENSVPTLNPVVAPYLNPKSELLVLNLAKELNKEATDFIKTKGAESVITYCNNEIDKDKNSLTTLKTTLPQVVKDLLSIKNANKPEEILTLLDKFLPNGNSVRKTVEMLDFLQELKKDVTYELPAWSQALESKTKAVNKIISDLAAHHNTVITNFLKTEGAELIVNYCKNEINNHKGSVDALRTNLKVVLKDLQDLQNPDHPITSDGFSNKISKYFMGSNLLKDTVGAFDYLKKNINGTIACDLESWSAALKATTATLKKLTDNPEVKYDSVSNVLSLKGIIVGTSDLSTELSNHPNPVKIDVLGLNTLFIDANVVSRGTYANFMAPEWKVNGSKSVTLTGKDSAKAANGGASESDGTPGVPGGNGGYFYGKGVSFKDLNKLTITVNGGKGGEGGDGAKGTTGASSTDGSAAAMALQSSVAHVELQNHTYMANVPVTGTKSSYQSGGDKGGKGGTGGLGGAAGKGGRAGVAYIDGPSQSYTCIKNPGGVGKKGGNGAGGEGGKGGDLWKSVHVSELTGSYGRVYQQGWGPTRHDVHVTEIVTKPATWELSAQKVGEGAKGDAGDQPAANLVSSVAPKDPTKLVNVDANGKLTSDYKTARFNEYKEFQLLKSIDPVVSPFIKLFTHH